MKKLTLQEHLNKVRKIAHETQRKNGHFNKMLEIRWKKNDNNKSKN